MKKLNRFILSLFIALTLCVPSYALNRVQLSTEYFPNPVASKSLSNANIYVGNPDTDPEVVANRKPISALQENGTIVSIAQPVKTGLGGIPVYNGSPITILVDGQYSIKVTSSSGAQLYYVPVNYKTDESPVTPVSDITSLRATLSQTGDGEIVYLSGHTSISDGGQGHFYWDADSVIADNNGTIIQVTGVATGRWIRQINGFVTPEMFGPNTTPGTTDMTAEIQAAIDFCYANSNRYKVSLLGSVYAVSATINTYSGTAITGVSNYETSQGTRIKWIGGNNASIISLYDYNVISNIFIYNGNASTGIIGVDCIGAIGANRRSSHLTMKNVSVKSCAIGMSMKYMWYNSIEQFSATYCTTGLYIDTAVNNTVFTACHTSNTTNGLLSVTGGSSLQITFNSCSFESSSADALDLTDPVEWYFNNCYFELNSTYCAKLTSPKGVTFKRCFVTNCLKGLNVIGNHGLEVDSCTFNLSGVDKTRGFTFSGDFADQAIWKKNRLVISNVTSTSSVVGYLTSAIERYPELVTEGLLDFNKSNVTILETGLLDASVAQTECIIPYLSKRGVANKRMSLALLEVYDPIITTAFRVRFGYSGSYDQYINNLYSSDVPAGVHVLPNVTPGLSPILPAALYTPGAGNIDRINNVTTGATGTYKMVFVLTE